MIKLITARFKTTKLLTLLSVVLLLCFDNINAQDTSNALTFSGYADVYYLINFNKPYNNTQPSFLYSFNRSNEVNLNLC